MVNSVYTDPNILRMPIQPPAWVNEYVGIPFVDRTGSHEESDCWGLLEMVLKEQFKIQLPEYTRYAYEDGKDRKKISDYMFQMAQKYPWNEVPINDARSGDALLIRMGGLKTHVSVVVSRGWMLHTGEGIESVLERYDGTIWKHRVLGAYRHADLLG